MRTRFERQHGLLENKPDQRTPSQIDRDRILYSSAFLRLSGVTQVVSPYEGRVCHNRLIHSLKVAQAGRRLAEFLLTSYQKENPDLTKSIDPDVVEAASLAHDLGHPPFGHVAEEALQQCFGEKKIRGESFEGNAQSFRVVTKLAVRHAKFDGLDLTRATLNSLIKYPWMYNAKSDKITKRKWGAYKEDKNEFDYARKTLIQKEKTDQTIEAEIMDLADDITYAVHDLEDFYRAGLIPLERLISEKGLSDEGELFADEVINRQNNELPGSAEKIKDVFYRLMFRSPIKDPFRGSVKARAALRAFTSDLIGKYIKSAKLNLDKKAGERLTIDDEEQKGEYRIEIFMLKQLTWHYVINNPALYMQQEGQKKLIKCLFDFYFDAIANRREKALPPWGRNAIIKLKTKPGNKNCARLAADIVSGMTDQEAENAAHKILGISRGSAFDPVR